MRPLTLPQLRREMWAADDRLDAHRAHCAGRQLGTYCLTCRQLQNESSQARNAVRDAHIKAMENRGRRNRQAMADGRANA